MRDLGGPKSLERSLGERPGLALAGGARKRAAGPEAGGPCDTLERT